MANLHSEISKNKQEQRMQLRHLRGRARVQPALDHDDALCVLQASIDKVQALHETPRFVERKHQSPSDLAHVCILYKRHWDTCRQTLTMLLDTQSACPYDTDGLIFTPRAMAYALGMVLLTCIYIYIYIHVCIYIPYMYTDVLTGVCIYLYMQFGHRETCFRHGGNACTGGSMHPHVHTHIHIHIHIHIQISRTHTHVRHIETRM